VRQLQPPRAGVQPFLHLAGRRRPSIGVPQAAWGFAPPGTFDSQAFGFPGANGNYTNGQTASLLGMSAICTNGGGDVLFKRQDGVFVIVSTTHNFSLLKGIWSGCQ
jgi:hypothetical protein